MFRLWGKCIQKTRIEASFVFESDTDYETPEAMVALLQKGLYAICLHFDLQNPLWLKGHATDVLRFQKTQFKQDHFIEAIDFDYLEVEIID